MLKYMLDGNAIDYLVDHKVNIEAARTVGTLYITTVQQSELRNVPNLIRRKDLKKTLDGLAPKLIPVMTPVLFDEMRMDDRAIMQDNPSEFESDIYGSSEKLSAWKDATIGGVTREYGCILVTFDVRFSRSASRVGVETITPERLFGRFIRN